MSTHANSTAANAVDSTSPVPAEGSDRRSARLGKKPRVYWHTTKGDRDTDEEVDAYSSDSGSDTEYLPASTRYTRSTPSGQWRIP